MITEPEITPLPDSGKMTEKEKQLGKWQNKILPWLIIMPTILILLFIYLATQQVNNFSQALSIKENSGIESVLNNKDTATLNKLKSNLDYIKWTTLTKMEEESLQKRYYQGGLLLLSRIFIKYLGFLTGMIIAIVGAVFIIGKLNEDSSKIEGSAGDQIRVSIISSSPGIIFGVLGTVLMVSTILQHNDITVQDSPLYLNAYSITSLKNQGTNQEDSSNADNSKIDPTKAANAFKK